VIVSFFEDLKIHCIHPIDAAHNSILILKFRPLSLKKKGRIDEKDEKNVEKGSGSHWCSTGLARFLLSRLSW